MDDTTLALFEVFSQKMKENSRHAYKWEIERFENVTGVEFVSANKDSVAVYLQYMDNKGIASSTLSKQLHILSSFGEFLFRQRRIKTNPFQFSYAGLKTYKDLKSSDLLKREDTELLFDKLTEQGDLPAAMVGRIILYTGATLSEVLELEPYRDISYSEGQGRFRICFHNYMPYQYAREVPLPLFMTDIFQIYLDSLEGPYLFPSKRGKRMSSRTLHYAFQNTGLSITPTDLRVSAKLFMVKEGVEGIEALTGDSGRWLSRYRNVEFHDTSAFDNY